MTLSLEACDFLDVVPEGAASEDDIWKTSNQAETFIYRCYSGIPDRWTLQGGPDICGGGDFISGWYGYIDYFHWKSLVYNKNRESPSYSYFRLWDSNSATFAGAQSSWNYDLYGYIRNCWYAINKLPSVPGISGEQLKKFTGECYFLIALYHQILLEYYGPIILVTKEQPFNSPDNEVYAPRSKYDDCVDSIAANYKKAITMLPSSWPSGDVGRATTAAAYGFLARLYLSAASPLVNGNKKFYADLKNKNGQPLMNLSYDNEKWKLAMDAAKNAITFCEANGYSLYYENTGSTGTSQTFNQGVDNYHNCFTGTGNNIASWYNSKEYLFSIYTSQASYNIQSMAPRVGFTSYNSLGFRGYMVPTWDAINMYLSKNGLPMNIDPETKDINLYSVAQGDSTALLNRNREPRFYASVGYDRGLFDINGGTISIHSRAGEAQGMPSNASLGYQGWLSRNGYFCKKWISKMDSYNASKKTMNTHSYAFPYLRMAELYLDYAEAEFEYTGHLDDYALACLNKVRYRAGLPSFEDSWSKVGGIPTGDDLRQEIHRERSIEFLMEGRRYYDIRRWMTAETEMMRQQKAWTLTGKTQQQFYVVTNMYEDGDLDGVRTFASPRDYWLAIPFTDMNKNLQLVQNPGY